uniref:Uncharacterized protein n=1 Tax=Caenorhabditis japonica TaxID=281687 RepID=A0A8R1IDS2_CAEJA
MGRKNGRRNKSTASVGSKKSRAQSVSTGRFQPSVDGFSAFLVVVFETRKEWTGLYVARYQKSLPQRNTATADCRRAQRHLLSQNMTKREIFELPKVKKLHRIHGWQ